MPLPRKSDLSVAERRIGRQLGDLPEYITQAEIRRAFDEARNDDQHCTAVLLGFLWATGARVSEALALTPADLDVDRRMVRLPTLKRRRKDGSGRKTSAARVVAVAGNWLTPVLGYIVESATGPHERVFPIGRQHAWRLISHALRAAGVESGRAKCHAIRHGHAVHAVLSGVPLNILQRQLGHASIVNTAIYLRVTGQDVRESYDRFAW
jgi:site-specific recombinase XerD